MTIGFKRIVVILFLILFQLFFVGFIVWLFPDLSRMLMTFLHSISFIIALFIIRLDISPDYKLTWLFLIFVAPVMGVIIYLIANRKNYSFYEEYLRANEAFGHRLHGDSTSVKTQPSKVKKTVEYLTNHANAKVYKGNYTKFYPLGELLYEDMLVELRKAEKFIFMEYFIVKDGKMLDSIIDILKQKVSEGVEVRFMFDSLGSLTSAPNHFSKELEAYGITCYAFNNKVSLFDFVFNNRNHRKITIIDGKVVFTGGINIADEYINKIEVFGHWKDTGIKVIGSSVNSFTLMFLSVWAMSEDKDSDYEKYLLDNHLTFNNDSYVAPYTYYPHSKERVGKVMYNSMIKKASNYLYITTPYLVLDYTMLKEFIAASKEGVDIRIIMPGIPDKKMVYLLSRSFYRPLLEAGVRIFEYTPGFIHSKQFVSDDDTAIVGTINLDYRSLTHHFENAIWLYNDKSVMDVKKDFLDTLSKCREVRIEEFNESKIEELVVLPILRAFAPLF